MQDLPPDTSHTQTVYRCGTDPTRLLCGVNFNSKRRFDVVELGEPLYIFLTVSQFRSSCKHGNVGDMQFKISRCLSAIMFSSMYSVRDCQSFKF